MIEKVSANKPGSYELVIRISDPILDPGDILLLEVYITGFGKIESPKIAFYPSWDVFSHDKSKLSIGESAPKPIDDAGGIIFLNEQSFSNINNSCQILSEVKRPKAPVNIDLATYGDARPGEHIINFVLTYFNGEEWSTKYSSINFTLRNFYQRHETKVWLIGAITATITILNESIKFWPKMKIIIGILFSIIKEILTTLQKT